MRIGSGATAKGRWIVWLGEGKGATDGKQLFALRWSRRPCEQVFLPECEVDEMIADEGERNVLLRRAKRGADKTGQ